MFFYLGANVSVTVDKSLEIYSIKLEESTEAVVYWCKTTVMEFALSEIAEFRLPLCFRLPQTTSQVYLRESLRNLKGKITMAVGPFLYPWKGLENQRLSDIFRGCRNG